MQQEHRRGFTLLELVVALSVAGALAGITAVSVGSTIRKTRLLRAARTLAGDLKDARQRSASGASFARSLGAPPSCDNSRVPCPPTLAPPGSPSLGDTMPDAPQDPPPEPPPSEPAVQSGRVRYAGIVVRARGYEVYSDDDQDPENGETLLRAVELADPEGRLAVESPPPGTRIVFRSDGTRDPASPGVITLLDRSTQERLRLSVTVGGMVRVD